MHLLSPLVCAVVLVGNISIEKGKEKVKTSLSKGLCKHTQSDGTTSFEGMERLIVGIADSKVHSYISTSRSIKCCSRFAILPSYAVDCTIPIKTRSYFGSSPSQTSKKIS